ncbi:MAG: hypothetical protein HQK49_06965 [Oligoflexia bacterium]|nr:hypothetical protein [Oligoflexia bacterium]
MITTFISNIPVIIIFVLISTAEAALPEGNSLNNHALLKKHLSYIEQGNILSYANVSDNSNSIIPLSISKIFKKSQDEKAQAQQKIEFLVSGLHKSSCQQALPHMNKYEDYQKYIGVISESYYNQQNKNLVFLFDFKLLPYQLMLQMQLDRITKSGNYPYILKGGIFPDLGGVINVSEYNKRCLFIVSANWQGPKSNIPNFILELFLETVAKISLEKLFRISAP